nr:sulfatase-like hydrolase/transferase [Mycobacterium leprae]
MDPQTPEATHTFTEDLAGRTMSCVRRQQERISDTSFFIYFAPSATHAPHHVPTYWLDKYQGKFHEWLVSVA